MQLSLHELSNKILCSPSGDIYLQRSAAHTQGDGTKSIGRNGHNLLITINIVAISPSEVSYDEENR